MSPIVDHVWQPSWPERLAALFGRRHSRRSRLPGGQMADIGRLTERELRDIGIDRPGIARQVDQELAALRRNLFGPLL